MRGATLPMMHSSPLLRFQLTRPMRGATDVCSQRSASTGFQLTRPMRGATYRQCNLYVKIRISTHTPHAGRDLVEYCLIQAGVPISTHTPHAGRDSIVPVCTMTHLNFNSHAPCGARHFTILYIYNRKRFQLTRPMRGATATSCRCPPQRHHMKWTMLLITASIGAIPSV